MGRVWSVCVISLLFFGCTSTNRTNPHNEIAGEEARAIQCLNSDDPSQCGSAGYTPLEPGYYRAADEFTNLPKFSEEPPPVYFTDSEPLPLF